MDFLLFVVIILGVVAFAQLIRVFELSEELKGEEALDVEVTDRENKWNSRLMFYGIIAFILYFFYLIYIYKDVLLPEAASEHGPAIDSLFNVTVYIISSVFIITHLAMGYFLYKYYKREGNKAIFYTHNDKLEIIWTIIPSIVLGVLIVYGLNVWNEVIYPKEGSKVIELYGKQFKWLARYPGNDNALGAYNYRLIESDNELGLDSEDQASWDDIVTTELHLKVNEALTLNFRSQDILHSAYLPHFRVQMNVVPGMTTQFGFTPNITTEEMRKKLGNENFDYVVICNKICGAAHYTMKMIVKVEDEETYNAWMSEQKAFKPITTTSDEDLTNKEKVISELSDGKNVKKGKDKSLI